MLRLLYPAPAPASSGKEDGDCSQRLAPQKGFRGRALAQSWRGSKMGKPEGEGRGGLERAGQLT